MEMETAVDLLSEYHRNIALAVNHYRNHRDGFKANGFTEPCSKFDCECTSRELQVLHDSIASELRTRILAVMTGQEDPALESGDAEVLFVDKTLPDAELHFTKFEATGETS